MEAQLQTKLEAEERLAAIKELQAWTSKQKEKDDYLSKSNSQPKLTRSSASTVPETPSRIEHSSQQGGTSSTSKQQTQPEKQAKLPGHKLRSEYGQWDKFDVEAALAEAADGETDNQAQPTSQHQPQQASTGKPSASGSRNGSLDTDFLKRIEGVSHASGLSVRHTIKRPKAAHTSAKQASSADGHRRGMAGQAESDADTARQEGNEAYKRGDMKSAEVAYTRSIKARPSAAAFANRAMVHLKAKEHAKAEQDCSSALALDPSFLKAWQRRATARRQLGKLLDAAQDIDEALRLEPSSKALQGERQSCIAAWRAQSSSSRSPPEVQIPVTRAAPLQGRVQPAAKQAVSEAPAAGSLTHAAQRRAKVAEASGGLRLSGTSKTAVAQPSAPAETVGKSTGAAHPVAPTLPDGNAMPSSSVLKGGIETPGAHFAAGAGGRPAGILPISTPDAVQSLENGVASGQGQSSKDAQSSGRTANGSSAAGTATSSWQKADGTGNRGQRPEHAGDSRQPPGSAGGVSAPAGTSGAVPTLDQGVIDQLASLGVASTAWEPQQQASAAGDGSGAKAAPNGSTRSTALQSRPPNSAIEFETVWRGLKGDLGAQAAYLRLLDPNTLPAVFKQSLTGPLLASIVAALLTHLADGGSADSSIQLLAGFQRVPRFAMASMSLGRADRTSLCQLWDAAAAGQTGPSAQAVSVLRTKYRI